MKALVYKSTGSWYIVKDETGRVWNARLKGIFKLDDITSTNPLAVGDRVGIEVEDENAGTAMITAIDDRENYINRVSPKANHQQHIIAANLDQSALVATLKEPRTSQGFIDRFLAASEAYRVPVIVIFNKADLYGKKEQKQFEEYSNMYEAAGYRVFLMSVKENQGVDVFREVLKDKITLLSGHSGVGKSALLNAILPGLALRTHEISGWSGKGMHTTTFAEMFDLPFGGKIIDTPGMREFGLINIDRHELGYYFPEFRKLMSECQFNDCLHLNEPGCAVKDAVEKEEISIERYYSYCKILDSLEENFKS